MPTPLAKIDRCLMLITEIHGMCWYRQWDCWLLGYILEISVNLQKLDRASFLSRVVGCTVLDTDVKDAGEILKLRGDCLLVTTRSCVGKRCCCIPVVGEWKWKRWNNLCGVCDRNLHEERLASVRWCGKDLCEE